MKNSSLTAHPCRGNRLAKVQENKGFALIATLMLMILLTIIAVGLMSMSSISIRSSNSSQAMAAARANARMALMLAIGDLQKSAGADQRVTASADILPATKPATTGRVHWTGVWNTSSYNQAKPDTKTFVRWLVSGNPSSPADATATAGADDVLVFEGKDAAASVRVPKVKIEGDSKTNGAYAYWIEDEGLKADLGWNEGEFTNNERKQAARLAAAPGPDYESFKGPFTDKTTYPITTTAGNAWLGNLDKALSAADMPLVMSDPSNQSAWLRERRHDMTLGSRGVLADVKLGGLRRDLSLAFEMDGNAEAENATKFNQQAGEFVGNGDSLSAPRKPAGLPVNERFLWRAYSGMSAGTGTEFSSGITADPNRRGQKPYLRGPNWWALRDYANLYKRLSGSAGDYAMPARAYFPNRSSERLASSDYHSHFHEGQTWDVEIGVNDSANSFKSSINTNEPITTQYYLYRPARTNYAPVNLGTSVLVSILSKNISGTAPDQRADLAIGLDPLFYFWNPYNRKIKCENIAVVLGTGLPGRAVFDVKKSDNTLINSYDLNLATLLKNNVTYKTGEKLIFLIKGPMVIEPGEVVIASPIAAPTGGIGTGEAILGYATDNNSGIIMTKLIGNSSINVRLDDKVSFSYLRSDTSQGSSSIEVRHEMDTSLPQGSGITPTALAANMTLLGEQTQHNLQVLWSGNSDIVDQYVSPAGEGNSTTKVRSETVSSLVNTKAIFGAHSLLIKPASPGGKGTPRPHEMFARFNPAPSLMKRDYYARCNPNQIYRHVTASSTFAVLSDSGIDFSGAIRNTFWGLSYQNNGSIAVPVSNIPSSPLFSLASFSDANLSILGTDPFHAAGNSWSSPLIPPSSAFGAVKNPVGWNSVGQDFSWLINDSLFDRYYLSGIAPEFTIGIGGYSATGSLDKTLTNFFSSDYTSAQANPVLRPYLPPGKTAAVATAELAANDGYKKTGAYSLIDGAFNVNSTSVAAWAALLRANRNLAVDYAQSGGSDASSGSPFPSSDSPTKIAGAKPQWSGFSRLSDAQISGLATRIVAQVKLRGPFMSLSDFINHKMGTVDVAQSYTGALQAALDLEAAGAGGINAASRTAAEGAVPSYSSGAFNGTPVLGSGTKATTGIPGDITQAALLLPLAPRLAARSDTFRIRGYGEVRSADGKKILAQATCEAVLQRYPEYMDPNTDAPNNEPWDEATDPLSPSASKLNSTNQRFGRRCKVVRFRWLNPSEI
jgi:Tfp pilus assembly protein PilX